MKAHWHLGYSNMTACGILAYLDILGISHGRITEYDMVSGTKIDCANDPKYVTCGNCRRVMLLAGR